MRRNFLLVTVLAIMFVASITLAAKNGAVKSPLVDRDTGQPAGWVNMNINAKGVLILTVHLDVPGAPGAVQNINLWTQSGTGLRNHTVHAFVTLNAAGKGTKQIKVPLTIPAGTNTVEVYVSAYGEAGNFETDPYPVSVPVPKVK